GARALLRVPDDGGGRGAGRPLAAARAAEVQRPKSSPLTTTADCQTPTSAPVPGAVGRPVSVDVEERQRVRGLAPSSQCDTPAPSPSLPATLRPIVDGWVLMNTMRGVAKKVILAVIDGLGPALLDRAVAAGRAPTLAGLQQVGERSDACVSTFPSLTPVCLAALVTGEHPAGSRIPSMTWYHRGERRFIEYGSSLQATLGEGTRQMVEDVLVNYNLVHLSTRTETLFETLERAGLVPPAASTSPCRARVRRPMAPQAARRIARRMGIADAVYGPTRYFFGELFASDRTGAPRNFGGSVDRHGGHVARWLVTRDG